MTVTRYKRQREVSAESIRDAVLGVMRTKGETRKAAAAKPADVAKAAEVRTKGRAVKELVEHHAEVVAPMKISAAVMARARRKSPRTNAEIEAVAKQQFKPYAPPPGVLPDAAKPDMAMDSGLQSWAQNSFTNAWNFANPFGESFEEGIGFLGYAYLSQLTQRPEYRRIGERIATEMTRKWIRLTIKGEADPETAKGDDDEETLGKDKAPAKKAPDRPLDDEDNDRDELEDGAGNGLNQEEADEPTPEEIAQRKRNEALQKKLKEIDEDMKRLDVRGRFKTVAEFDGWMGRAHLYIDTGDGNDPEELLTDLGNGSDETSKDKFKKGSLRNIKHVEAMWCYPVRYNAQNPLADDWYNPQVWFAMGKQIHASRLLTFVGRPVPDILKPSYAFGGLSMSQMAKPYVDNWLRTRQAVTALIESFSVSGVYTNAQSLLQGGGEEVLDRIDLFNIARDNSGTMVLDKEAEEFFNISTPLGTLDHLQAQSQEQMSSVSGIPLIVLLGITPTGLNASSEGELRVFYDLILAMQESLFRDKLKRVIDFIQLNKFGEIDPAIGFEFEPLWSLDEKGEAEVKKIEAETHQIYVDMGTVGQEEIRGIIVADEDSPYNGLDPDDLPPPPAQEGMIPPHGGEKGGGGEGGDGHEMDGAADRALIEIEDDVYAFDDGQFDESKHKRDGEGKFSTTGGAGGESEKEEPKTFKSKKEHIGHLLSKGTTAKEVMQTMGWPSVSMPQQAKALGMKLEKKDGKYFGVPMTDAEKAEVKAQAVAKAAGWESKTPSGPVPEKTEPKKPMIPPATGEEMKKAKKSTPVPLSSSEPEAVEAIKAFNEKYQGKDNLTAEQLSTKVHEYKQMLAKVKQTESQAAEAAAQKVEANAKKLKAEKAVKEAKEKAELEQKFKDDPDLKLHYEAMEALFGGKDAGANYIKQANSKVKSAGLSKIMSGADAVPIMAYSGSHYTKVNSELRRGTMTVEQYKFMKSLNAGLDKLPPYKETTYRKASLTPEQFKAYVPGHIVEERGFTSTSKNQGTWSGAYQYVVHGKNGRDIQELSSHPGEAEVLFKSGSRFLVKSVKGQTIELEEV